MTEPRGTYGWDMVRYLDDDPHLVPEVPSTDARDVAHLVPAAIADILERAEEWLGWDGRAVIGEHNVWTPHKALRRIVDHLLDHLAEIDARLAGMETVPDGWHGRRLTLDSDWARFTEADLDEATSRLRRIALCYEARLGALDDATLDKQGQDGSWTVRQVVHHVSRVTAYADLLDGVHA
jgi:hypothetical protein